MMKFKNNLAAEYNNYIKKANTHTPNMMLTKIFRCAGITLDCKRKTVPVRMTDLAKTLCIAEVLVNSNHFSAYKHISPEDLWQEIGRIWNENKEAIGATSSRPPLASTL
jgi:hypothetical protein